jgi:protocatechuate 3,4-dioxygenase beta subunit
MDGNQDNTQTRRAFLQFCLTMPAVLVLVACAGEAGSDATPVAAGQAQPTAVPPTQAPPSPTGAPVVPSSTPASVSPTAAPSTPTATAPLATATTQPAPSATATVQPVSSATATVQVAQAPVLTPTPECGDDDDDPTPAQTEGPYYTRNTPERASLREAGTAGTALVISGQVLTTGCRPVARALIDFWQADDKGVYDNTGFRLRGHQFTDDEGRYALETIVPGLYPGRTRHIHVKVQAPDRPVLTTQLYFPGEARNRSDGIFNEDLLLVVGNGADGKVATFNFVLDID